MNPRVTIALVLVAVFALGAVALAAGGDDASDEASTFGSGFAGSVMPEGVRAPDFELTDQDGDPISMRDLRGEPVIVTFLYTNCEETCPLQAQIVKGALAELDEPVPAIAVAVDPPNDTERSARAFLADQRVAGLDFVLGTRAQLKPVWDGFAIQPQSVRTEHQARFTLVDPRGFQRVGFPAAYATPEALAHDIRVLQRGR